MSAREVTTAIEVAMRAKYSAPEWALMMGVANATGVEGKGWADAIAMSLWPSRGLALHGFEFKASRSDWLRELKKPAKAEKVAKYCDFWFLVCPPGVYEPSEIPLGWGVLELTGRGLVAKVPAAQLTPEPVDRAFLAALLRRSAEADEAVIETIVQKRVESLRVSMNEDLERRRKQDSRRYIELTERLAAVKAQTGIDLTSWKPPESTSAAIKLALAVGYEGLAAAAADMAAQAERFSADLRAALTVGQQAPEAKDALA